MKTNTLETSAVVGLSWFAGSLATAFVAGPIGWIGGPALLAAGEFYRRKQGLGMGEVSLGVARFTWDNAMAATQVMSGEAEAMVPVYANVVQKAKTLVDHGVQRPEVDLEKWVADKSELRSLIVAGLPKEGKTHTAKALISAILKVFPERYLKICTLDKGISHDDDAPETWLGLPNDFFVETIDGIRQEIEHAAAEMEQRYLDGSQGKKVNKYPYIVFVDELVATMGMLTTGRSKEYRDSLDQLIQNILVRGPKARVWLMGAGQKLDCKGTGFNQSNLLLFDFLLFPRLGQNGNAWRNLPDVPNKDSIIQSLQGAPQKAPKPVAVIRSGEGFIMTMPRIEVPDYIPVIAPGDEIEQWLKTQSAVLAAAVDEGLSATKAWAKVELPKGAPKAKLKDNDWWQRFRMRHAEMAGTQTGTQESEPGRTDEDL